MLWRTVIQLVHVASEFTDLFIELDHEPGDSSVVTGKALHVTEVMNEHLPLPNQVPDQNVLTALTVRPIRH